MALESLLEDAFRRGCGISRSYALRTPRYRELLESSPRVPNTTQAETAEMIYLGERLADRAFANLPYKIRKRAEQWSEMTDVERHQALNLLMTRLTTKEWLRIHRAKYQTDKPITEVLPAEYGSWSRGKVQPNCLGMTQILIGFARVTGADHLMVDVVTQHDHFTEELAEQTVRNMIRLLKPHADEPGIARLIRRLERYYARTLRSLVRMKDTAAHHALLIKIGEDWVLVDPYLSRKYNVGAMARGRANIHRTIMERPRRRWMIYGGYLRKYDCAAALASLHNVLELYARRDEPAKSFSLSEVIGKACGELSWIGIDPHTKTRLTRDRLENVFWQCVTESLLTRELRKTWPRGKQRVTQRVQDDYDRRIRAAEHRKRDRNAAMTRLIRHICLTGLDVIYDAFQSNKTDHRRIEVAHPTLHLAVMTLNHIGHKTRRSTIDLLRIDASQWIIHDTLEEVMLSDDKRLKRIAESNLRRIEKYPHQVMPALLAEFEKRK